MSSSIFKSYPKMSYFSGRSKRKDSEIQARDMPKLSENLTEKIFPYFCDLCCKKKGKLLKGSLRLLISVTSHRAHKCLFKNVQNF